MRARPPWHFWLIPALAALLRGLPFLLTQIAVPPAGQEVAPLGYNPLDGFAYVGFIRQAAEQGGWWLANAHTTLPQDGRFLLPLFTALGWLCRATGLDPFWALDLARVPLLFIFFWVVWRFLGAFLEDPRQRLWAAWFIGFSGGFEILLLATLAAWPVKLQGVLAQAISSDQGWSTFATFYNPLWIAGLTLALVALRPVLRPNPGSAARDRGQVALGWMACYFVHPYSGLAVLGVILLSPVVCALLGQPAGWRRWLLGPSGAVLPALVLAGVVALWQNRDPVHRLSAARVVGDYQLSVFWYPMVYGALGWLVLRGWRVWARDRHPARMAWAAWVVVLGFLHTCPLINGYHFAFHLHLPLCVVAAVGWVEWVDALRAGRGAFFWRVAALVLIFQASVATTLQAGRQVLRQPIPSNLLHALERLGREPAGRVYTSPRIGLMVPAYTHHRVYVGHWFLTPDHGAKQDQFMSLLEGRGDPGALTALVQRERIDYVLLPPAMPAAVAEALRPWIRNAFPVEGFLLLVMQTEPR